MTAKGLALYMEVAAMEPMFPETSRPELAELSHEIIRKSGQIVGQVPAAINRWRIATLVREMNSYYSNLIEGHGTLPREIESAMRQDYSQDEKKRENQLLARAHIKAEDSMRLKLADEPGLSIYSPEFLCWLHGELYSHLPSELRRGRKKNGDFYEIEPGKRRSIEVDVAAHQPPHQGALSNFLARFEKVFGNPQILATNRLIATAAAHHRLAWIHPFPDGNGRVVRLYSQACLIRNHTDGGGLWSLSRGLARERERYYERLRGADRVRLNDYDGRGNLSEKGLKDFCLFMLTTMLDQIRFMSGLLDLPTLSRRIQRYLEIELTQIKPRERERLGRLLDHALCHGEVARGEVGRIINMSQPTAQRIIRLAVREGLLASSTERGPLSLVFSARNLETFFPRLYLPLPADP